MRIDFVITELFVGGAERCLSELAIGLHDNGDDVRVFSIGSLPTGPRGALVDRMREQGIDIASADADSVWKFAEAGRRLKRWLQDHPAEVCQTFLFHANVLGTRAARSAGVDLCVGGLRVADRNPIRCAIERRAVRSMDSLVCVSESVQTFASESLKTRPDQTVVIPNAVDVSRFASGGLADWTTMGWPTDAVVTLFVGRMAKQKGLDLLQQQIDVIAPAETDRKLVLIGDGPLAPEIDRWCDSVGHDRVRRLPWQSDVGTWIRACRLLVLPSRYEGMPNVVMEAMAAGRPVVCSRVEGTSELFAAESQTIPSNAALPEIQLFDIGDGAAMSSRIIRFQVEPSLAENIGADNQARMQKHFSVAAMVDAYRSHYRRLLVRRFDDD